MCDPFYFVFRFKKRKQKLPAQDSSSENTTPDTNGSYMQVFERLPTVNRGSSLDLFPHLVLAPCQRFRSLAAEFEKPYPLNPPSGRQARSKKSTPPKGDSPMAVALGKHQNP